MAFSLPSGMVCSERLAALYVQTTQGVKREEKRATTSRLWRLIRRYLLVWMIIPGFFCSTRGGAWHCWGVARAAPCFLGEGGSPGQAHLACPVKTWKR